MALSLEVSDLNHTINLHNGTSLALLDGLSLRIEAGEHIAIVGASGCGKSTLLSLLAGLTPVQSGQVSYHAKNQALNTTEILAHSGFVFQQFHLLPELNALENVALPLQLRGHRDAAQQATHWLTQMGLEQRLTHNVTQLSGGEQQRVAIARALCVRPQVLFADEPTGNLDETTAEQVIDLMLSGARQSGTSLLLVTHDMALAKRVDKAFRLSHGRLVLCH
ncbi:ABC transporter ATP-binding protein [Pseudoalteromonas sp. McH1-42]|uniref:ABC transporter ATP-binding protein n=1 Tax=Pseudoalteromonas sp. McH1-42 TaxID=2917752 RepID=UPI001EF4B833|nr:ABC transporter ATP-binding protein [Pseudoalteromonas sp. McH1-42]MCG7560313.1 ABC transporter ATP-binding protein [Pseudoalteromonas sp. McH1-42]